MNEKLKIIIKPIIKEPRPVLITGGTRNEHGTRICRKVTCEKCRNVDYVAVSRSKNGDSLFCRNCAKEEIGAFEKGTKIKSEMAQVQCNQCTKTFDFPKKMVKLDSLLCSDCFQGFEVWRGSRCSPTTPQSNVQFSRRPSGTLLRKKLSVS